MFERLGYPRRSIRMAVIAVAVLTLILAPAVSAVEPVIIPAGEGCSFDVLLEPTSGPAGDKIGFADITMTNLDTGASYVQRSRYLQTETIDPATNTGVWNVIGRILIGFFPGDMGPYGVVGEPGAMLGFTGSFQLTYELDTGVTTAFSYRGHLIDLCARLAP